MHAVRMPQVGAPHKTTATKYGKQASQPSMIKRSTTLDQYKLAARMQACRHGRNPLRMPCEFKHSITNATKQARH
eukprot:9501305-Pyramimonas_sp.AAC.1